MTEIKIWSMRKLRANWVRITVATIQFITFLSSRLLSKIANINIYKTIIFPVVLYGCETLPLILKKECRQGIGGQGVQRVFGHIRGWMITSRKMRWARHIGRMGERNTAYRILVVKPERKRDRWGRLLHRWEDNIKMDLREIWWCGMDLIDLAQDKG
jgi:hypothetical protein